MKNLLKLSLRKTVNKGRPDYYITPTHDFTQYTKDCEEKYWNKETTFDWNQSVRGNLEENLENLNPEDFSKIAFMTLPMIKGSLERKIVQIRQDQLPIEEDALKDVGECIPFDRTTIDKALLIQLPLKSLQLSDSKLKDQLEILQSELLDLRELQRLGLFKEGTKVQHLETEAERQEQILELSRLTNQINQVQREYQQLRTQCKIEAKQLKTKIRGKLHSIGPQVLADMEETHELLQRTLRHKNLPRDPKDMSRLKDLILKRQLRGLKDIANHALVVEQSAIAPLTMGIIHYKRHREIQEAMTTFINDEAKHSATFRRFLVEKLEAREYISAILIKGANRYMWLARFMPGTGLFLAVPDSLFCSICKTISVQDETRHMDLCVAMYNELFRKGHRSERFRNNIALKVMMKSVYGDKTEDHHLIQAFRAFGVESEIPYQHISLDFLGKIAREYGDIVHFKMGPLRIVLLNHPDFIKEVLSTQHSNFVKGRPLEMAKELLGEGLLTNEGESHRRQSRIIQPAFHSKMMNAYAPAMTEYAIRLMKGWKDGMRVDMMEEMVKMSTGIAGKTMFKYGHRERSPGN